MGQRITVLFVEDDRLVRDILSETLAPGEFRTLIAESGSEALRILARERIDVLFTDVVMPDMNGIELASFARLVCPDLKIMFMTGYFSHFQEAERIGPALTKPVRPDDVVRAIRLQFEKPH
jgi:two-component system cell cycle response regulator CpdR